MQFTNGSNLMSFWGGNKGVSPAPQFFHTLTPPPPPLTGKKLGCGHFPVQSSQIRLLLRVLPTPLKMFRQLFPPPPPPKKWCCRRHSLNMRVYDPTTLQQPQHQNYQTMTKHSRNHWPLETRAICFGRQVVNNKFCFPFVLNEQRIESSRMVQW